MRNCENCIHCDVCDRTSRQIYATIAENGICGDYKDKSLIVELPCKLGDTVYLIPTHNGNPYCGVVEDKVQMIGITSRGVHIKARNHHDHNKMYMLGKGAFLNREEAEKALREREKNESERSFKNH